ncbi:sensor histidine kinase [Paenibacillus sp. KN14-4R]|uniref:sensor histidine kinase n=1 Tax=Paenibacillus sp. KN14-4R TaxID=3445773 RepID=UPI003F9F30C2
MNAPFWPYLTALLFMIIIGLLLHINRVRINNREVLSVLEDIENGNHHRKIFAHGKGVSTEISYKINHIVEQYQHQILEFERSAQSNKQLLTSLSHDVRTPLTSLLGYLDALHQKLVHGEERDEYIEIAKHKAYDLKNFVDTLFEWFKLDSKERIFTFEQLDINELTRELIIGWMPLLEMKKMKVDIDISEHEWRLLLDKDAYKRMINNLIQNALTHSGGDFLKLSLVQRDHHIVLKVTDNGKGIPKEKLPYIFDRLYKCDDSRSLQGSGLGLSIVKELVHAHNGTIKALSLPYEMTTFIVSLPYEDEVREK